MARQLRVRSPYRRCCFWNCSESASSSARTSCSASSIATWSGDTRGNFLDLPHRLPAARRAARLDRRHRGLRSHCRLPLRRRDFLPDWLADVATEQRAADGMVSFVVPDVLKYIDKPSYCPPEHCYLVRRRCVGTVGAVAGIRDLRVLSDQYDSMASHVRRVESLLSPTGLWDSGFPFGDGWIRPYLSTIRSSSKADNSVVAAACLTAPSKFLPRPPACLDAAMMPRISQVRRACENCLQRQLRER